MATNNSNNTKTVTVVNYNDPVPGSTPLLQVLNSPGGNKYEIQINNGAGGFAATNSFVYSPVTGNVGLRGNLAVTGKISGKMTTSTQNLQIVGGTSGYVLSTDGTGNISWVDPMDGQYGNSNVANYLPTYNGDIGLDNITITGNTTAVNINATSITSNTLTSSENSYLYNVSATGLASLTTVTVGGNFTMNGGTANLGQASRVKITGGAADYFLQTDGTGNVTWAPIATSSTLQQVTTAGHTTNVAVQFTNSTQSINQTTGAVVVTGGIAAGGNVHGNHIHAASSMYAQQTVYSGQNSIGSSFTKPLFIGKDTGDEYVQAAMVNSNANGSADWAAYSDSGGDAQGWIDMGFTGTTFSDANYSITHPSDGYLFVEGMPGQGGNLVIATGDLGDATHRDIIFATGGFLTENEFARIDHANNVFHLTKAGSGIQFEDGTIQTTAGGGSNPFNQDLNTTDNVTFAQITATDVVKFTNSGGVVGAIGYAPTYISIEGWQSNTVNITTNDVNTWQFGTDGKLTLPDGTVIGDIEGANTFGFYNNNSNTAFLLETPTNVWSFDNTGNLLAPGNIVTPTNFVGTSLRTNLGDFNWSDTITGIATGATTVITLANNVFGDPWSGQVTITDVAGTTEANATWWYQAVDSNQFALYTDNTLSTPVDSTAWGSYVSGGFAVTLDYGNIEINGQNIIIRSDHGDYDNKIWSFNRDGSTRFPQLTVDLHNGGSQSGQVLQFSENQQAIITGPTPAPDTAAQRLIIQGQRGNGLGEGGDVYVWAGDAEFNGGDIKIYAGDADDATAGSGGYINLDGGSGFDGGGQISVTGGYSPGGTGGPVYISAGQGTTGGVVNINGGGASINNGGAVTIQGGFGQNDGGAVTIQGGGSGLGLPGYGNVQVTAGVSTWTFDNSGNLQLPGNVISTQPHGITIGSNYDVYIVGDRTDNNHTWKFDGSTTELILPGGVILDPSDSNFEVRGVENVNFEANTVVNIYTNTSLDGYQWQFGDDAVLTLPTITPSVGLAEISNIRSQRKVIPAYHYSAEIVGSTPTIVYTVTNSSIVTMKATMTVQHQGLGFEILDVIASTSGGDTYYTVSNRVKPPTIADTTVSVGLNGSYQMEITMTVNSGASYSWVTYDVTEFGIPVD